MNKFLKDDIKISAININNSKANLVYLSYLFKNNQITYINEHWLLGQEKYYLENLSNQHKIYLQSDMQYKPKKGRPFGGQAWAINKYIKDVNVEFINQYISTVKCKLKNQECCLIGVHMPYDDNGKDTVNYYVTLLDLIKAILKEQNNKNISTIIMGDFNADIRREKRVDKVFGQFIESNSLTIIDELMCQISDFTYENGCYKANIDHILLSKNNFLNVQCNILDDVCNVSDHRALEITFDIKCKEMVDKNIDRHRVKIVKKIQILNIRFKETNLYVH